MAKPVAIILANDFEDIELTSPKEAIEDAGYKTVIIGSEAGEEVTGKHGTKAKVEVGIASAEADEYSGLLIPGGFSPDHLRGDVEGRFGAFAKGFIKDDEPIFAICHGPQVLIDTDALKGRTLTAVLNVRKDLSNAGANVKDESVIIDGNLVTSRTPEDLNDFNKAIVETLNKENK